MAFLTTLFTTSLVALLSSGAEAVSPQLNSLRESIQQQPAASDSSYYKKYDDDATSEQPAIATSDLSIRCDGWSVTKVMTGSSTFLNIGQGQWLEDGTASNFVFQETVRDEWSVYLFDARRNVRLQLDLHRRVILLSDPSNGIHNRPQFSISTFSCSQPTSAMYYKYDDDASFEQPATSDISYYKKYDDDATSEQPATSDLSIRCDGWSVTKVMTGSSTFLNIGQGQWLEDGTASNFVFQETGRDEWSVYLFDARRNVRLQLDLHRRVILLSDPSNGIHNRPQFSISTFSCA